MFKTLEVKNFKSIGHAVLELGKINVLTGPSNLGKSNIVQALYCLTHNSWDSNYMKWGEKKCSVKLIDDTGEWVEYLHNETSAEYRLSSVPTPFTKIGRDVPDPVKEFLKMNLVQFDEDLALDFNFEKQFDQPFMISLSGFELAKVFGKIMNLDIVLSAARSINKDIAALKKNVESQEAIENVSIQYIQYNYNIELKYALLHKALKIDSDATVLENSSEQLKSIISELEYYSECAKVYSEFLASDTAKSIDTIKPPIQGLDNIIVSLMTAQEAQEVYSKALSKEIPSFDFEGLEKLIRGLQDYAIDSISISNISELLTKINLVDFSSAEQLSTLGSLIGAVDQYNVEVTYEHNQFERQESAVDKKVKEFNAYLQENNICPISGKPFMDGCIAGILESV